MLPCLFKRNIVAKMLQKYENNTQIGSTDAFVKY